MTLRAPAARIGSGGTSPSAPLLRLDDLGRAFDGRPGWVLDGLGLHLPQGVRVGVVGRNWAGKTTLLRVVAGLLRADRGRIRLDGLDPVRDGSRYRERLGWLPAGNAGLHGRLTVSQHLDVWARIAGLRPAARAAAIERTAHLLDLDALRARRALRLSTGQRQRLRLGLALVARPRLVLLDEPHASLDGGGRERLELLLDDACDAGSSVLWCSPEPETAPAADLLLELRDGRLRTA